MGMFAMPVLTYSFGILNWSMTDTVALDRFVRREISNCHSHHPKASVQRLYLSRKSGGRGMVRIEDLYSRHLATLLLHLTVTSDNSLRWFADGISERILQKLRIMFERLHITVSVGSDGLHLNDELVVNSARLSSFIKSQQQLVLRPLH
jgi:hypothetical protein